MNGLVLSKSSQENDLKRYFTAVLELSQSDNKFPINIDEVWQLVYAERGVAVKALKKNFFEYEDFISFDQNVKRETGSSVKTDYFLSLSCLEYFIARKVRPVFEVYRQVFHKVAETPSYQIADPIKRAERWIEEEKERQLLQAQNKKMLPKAEYYDEVLQKKSTFTMTEVADEMGLSVHKLTKELICHDIIYKASGRYLLKVPFKGWRLHETRTPNNAHATPYLVWNERGRMFIHKLRDNNWNARATINEINPEWNGSLQIDCNAAS